MADLHQVSGPLEPRANVIFVHGLSGHPLGTWGDKDALDKTYWPNWLADDFPGTAVWVMSYSAPKTNWLGNALALGDRGQTALQRLKSVKALRGKPLVFICHSLGGLVMKQVMRLANDEVERLGNSQPEHPSRDLLASTKGIVFISTPHLGSHIATVADWLRLIIWPSYSTRNLIKNDDGLRQLNNWYRFWLKRPRSISFFETEVTAGLVTVVPPDSGDAGASSESALPIERGHSAICIPPDRTDLLYTTITDFGEQICQSDFDTGTDRMAFRSLRKRYPRSYLKPVIKKRFRLNILPFSLRLMFLLLVGVLAYLWLRVDLDDEPLRDLDVSVSWTYPTDFVGSEALMARLRPIGKQLQANPKNEEEILKGAGYIDHSEADGFPLGFSLTRESNLYPRAQQEPEAWGVAEVGANISCFKTHSAAEDFLSKERPFPKLSLGYFASDGDYAFGVDSSKQTRIDPLSYDIENDKLVIWIQDDVEDRWIKRTGQIRTVTDLLQSFCLAMPEGYLPSKPKDVLSGWPTVEAARNSVSGGTIFFSVSGRRFLVRLTGDNRKKFISGQTYFAFPMSLALAE